MRKKLVLCLIFLCVASAAHAQSARQVVITNYVNVYRTNTITTIATNTIYMKMWLPPVHERLEQVTVVVRPFTVSGGMSQDDGSAISDFFISELVSSGKVRLVDRESFDAIVKEMKFQETDWANDDKVLQLGKALKASSMIQGSVTSLAGQIVISIRVINMNEIRVDAAPSLRLAKMDAIFDKLPPFVTNLVHDLPGIKYYVGGVGPSGGYVFYDKGSYSNGWRYLEAAPESYEFILEANKSYSVKDVGAVCERMNIARKTGWRLPTKDELVLMYTHLKQAWLGGFNENAVYGNGSWDYDKIKIIDWAAALHFSDGIKSISGKYEGSGVYRWNIPITIRPVRQF